MPCLFLRAFEGQRISISGDLTPGCEWVLAGEGTPSRKRDGTATLWQGGALFRRYDAKPGKVPPPNALPCDPAPDPVTGHWPHWLPVGDGPDSKWHREAAERSGALPDGTYELCGPAFSANPEGFPANTFVRHGVEVVEGARDLRTHEELREFLRDFEAEGLVWAHPDGRMAKLRRADFGFAWPVRHGR